MSATFAILLPIFALILAGYTCRRRGLLGPSAASELNRFVVWLALPALLFDVMARTTWQQLYQPGFVATFSIACTAVFLVVLAQRLMAGRHLADASVDAIAASYPNTGYIGFPLALLMFGSESLMPTTIATILVACVLFAFAIVLIEAGLQAERAPHRLAWKVVRALARNPLIVAPIAGAAVAASGLAVPAGAETFLKLLGGAASPCALVSLGLFLADRSPAQAANASNAARPSGQVAAGSSTRVMARTPEPAVALPGHRTPMALTLVKLVVQPGLTWWLAAVVFSLPTAMVQIAVLLAALPTGTGPYMLAEFYRREAGVTSRTILFSTVASLLTLTAIMAYMHMGKGAS
ncbi:AEC family transporter [Bordetella genomosp. 13]|uniref:AEC family transporter n=1 Tax=Bordetella genomosp. 13 TaxID=463040 RepID=UPI00119E3FD7|nr:AEC family transporter [Bordetella genomosp. 13]